MKAHLKKIARRALLPAIRWQTRRRIAAYMAKTHPAERKLQCGCGTNLLPDWLNTDIGGTGLSCRTRAYLDVTRGLPFPDGSLARIFSEHMIEHLTLDQGRRFLG